MNRTEGYSPLYEAALQVATRAHLEQTRKGSGLPYIVHPVHVSVILLRHGFSKEAAVAGLLHDVVEDQDYELTEIQQRFGPRVAGMVEALTEQKRDARGNKRPWEVRKREALEKVRKASNDAVAVKAADTLHNARSFVQDLGRRGRKIWCNFNSGPHSQLDYYRKILRITEDRLGPHPLALELADAVDELAHAIEETHPDEKKPMA